MTPEELKKRVMKYLNKNGDTFCSISSQLLNSGMEQHIVPYLLNELERDQLIVLGRASDRLNTNAHVLNPASNIQAHINPQGKTYVKEHFSNSILDYLEKHPIIRTIVLIGGIGGALQ